MIRRVYKRTTIVERVAVKSSLRDSIPAVAQYFSVEIVRNDGDTETIVCADEQETAIEIDTVKDDD